MNTRTRKGRTQRTPEQQAAHEKQIIDAFDQQFPVGTSVWYWQSLPFGPVTETKIRYGAWFLDCGEPVCKVEGKGGGVSIWHITAVDESRRDQINFATEGHQAR